MPLNLSIWDVFLMNRVGTGEVESHRKVAGGSRVAVAIRSLVYDRSLQFECAGVLH